MKRKIKHEIQYQRHTTFHLCLEYVQLSFNNETCQYLFALSTCYLLSTCSVFNLSQHTSDPACVKRKMLSMKSSTSCPSTSRKYSATVSPVRATRARAPGGSFICPYTRDTWWHKITSKDNVHYYPARLNWAETIISSCINNLFLVTSVCGLSQSQKTLNIYKYLSITLQIYILNAVPIYDYMHYHTSLPYLRSFILQTDDPGFYHLVVKVISFTSPLPNTSEHGVTTVSFGYVVNQFHNQYSFSYSGSTKQTWNRNSRNQYEVTNCSVWPKLQTHD